MQRNARKLPARALAPLAGWGLLLAGAAGAGTEPADAGAAIDKPSTAYEEMVQFTEALLLVKRHYVEERPFRSILEGALDGMLRGLDAHSHYLPRERYEEALEETQGAYHGIGVTTSMRDGLLTVIAPMDGSPAYRAGIVSGDRILRIDGVDAFDLPMRETSRRLRGEVGTPVVLTIGRARRKPFEVRLVRERIVVASVRGARLLRPGIGYIRLARFDEQTVPEFRAQLDRLLGQGLRALVLDVRGNPGGVLTAATGVAETFLERGRLVVSVRGRHGETDRENHRAAVRRPRTNLPLAVLVDEGSASGSEVLAGALQDHRRAVLVGRQTFGKASVQTLIPLQTRTDSALLLTTAYYYTPQGHLIHGVGIAPDILVEMTPEDRALLQLRQAMEDWPENEAGELPDELAAVHDVALERAVDVLSALLTLGGG